jgi:diketogulonate reductase-like aldo/keto reductase
LQLDRIDLYLLHWRGDVPLGRYRARLRTAEAPRPDCHRGVSNFDMLALRKLTLVPGGAHCAANQVHDALGARGAGFDLLPWQRLQQMPLMAYSPFDQGESVDHPGLRALAQKHNATPAQVALAWV